MLEIVLEIHAGRDKPLPLRGGASGLQPDSSRNFPRLLRVRPFPSETQIILESLRQKAVSFLPPLGLTIAPMPKAAPGEELIK